MDTQTSPTLTSLNAARRTVILARQPWAASTGPQTVSGMRVSSWNAVTHGLETASFRYAMAYVDRITRVLADGD